MNTLNSIDRTARPADRPRLLSFDILRSLSIFGVFSFHFRANYGHAPISVTSPLDSHPFLAIAGNRILEVMSAGFIGVDLLFMLSGYLAFFSVQKQASLFEYIKGRYQRLLPIVFFVVLLPGLGSYSLKDHIDNILFLKIFPDSGYINYVTWILTYNIYFYFLIALVFITFKTSRYRWFFGALILGIFMHPKFYPIPDKIRFIGFLYGVLAAGLVASGFDALARLRTTVTFLFYPAIFALISIMLFLHGFWPIIESRPIFHVLFFSILQCLIFIVLVNAAIREVRTESTSLFARGISYFAMISYSFFILHATFISKDQKAIAKILVIAEKVNLGGSITHFVAALGIVTILSVFCFNFFERPYFTRRETR